MRPTLSTVSLSVANASVPLTLMPRITASDFVSYVIVWPSRISTRAPAAGTCFPSQVAAADHGPLFADLITPGSAANDGAASSAQATREESNRTGGSVGRKSSVARRDGRDGWDEVECSRAARRLNPFANRATAIDE